MILSASQKIIKLAEEEGGKLNFTYLPLRSEEGITTITLNRPKQATAFNWETSRELKQEIEAFWARREKR